ncbi:MAG: insulinase family protein [Myxococcales bacterium]|jgi:predicted Zn-dependent peptidase|nr:insulinase family protein [Myxococcales bacterium]
MPNLPSFLTPPETPRLSDASRWAVREETLGNGLRVRLLEDHALPICSMRTFFRVGSRDELPGQTGVSHLLEHMMFNGTPRVGPRMFDQLLESQGGQSNAFTSRDMTAYENDFAASALDAVLRLESDRLAGLALVPEVLAAELDVVLEERRVSTEESIGGRLDEALYALAFEKHPYRAPIIGWRRDLERLDRETCLAHFQSHYAPDNAVLWLVGDFDAEEILAKIRDLYGSLPPARRANAHRIELQEPEQRAERRVEISFPAHSESLLIGYKTPPATSRDAPIIELLSFLLSAGPGARLVRQLVYEAQAAVAVGAEFAWLEHPGLFTLQLDLKPEDRAEDALEHLDRLLDAIVTRGFEQAELEQAKAEWRIQFLKALATCHGRCELFGMNEQLLGDWRTSFEMAQRIAQVTMEQVRATAERLFQKERRSVVILRPGERTEASEIDSNDDRASCIGLESFGSLDSGDDADRAALDVVDAIPEALLAALPPLDPHARIAIPAFADRTLPNGMRVAVARQDAVPLFSVCLSFGAGSAHEPAAKDGIADFTMELLRRGTERLSAAALDAALARLGCTLGMETGLEAVSIVASAPAESLVPVLELIAELVQRPSFDDSELTAARARTAARLRLELDEPSLVVHETLCRVAFGGHPYGRSGRGLPATVLGFTHNDVCQMATRLLAPERAILTLAGDVLPDNVFDTVARCFGDWTHDPHAQPLPDIPMPPDFGDGTAILLADMPGSEQAQVVLASRAPGKRAPDHFPTTLAAYVLGGSFTSRLVEAVRVERGLSYGLSCAVSGGLRGGLFTVGSFTKNEALGELIDVVCEETALFRASGPTPDELNRSRRSLCGLLPLGLESSGSLARAFNDVLRLGRPRDFLERSFERVLSVDTATIQASAQRSFLSAGTRIAVAGDAQLLAEDLKAFGQVRVVSLEQLSRGEG